SIPITRNSNATGSENRSVARLNRTLTASRMPTVARKTAVASGSATGMAPLASAARIQGTSFLHPELRNCRIARRGGRHTRHRVDAHAAPEIDDHGRV